MKIEVLYPEICNLYGDLGNIRYLQKSCPELEIVETNLKSRPAFLDGGVDLVYVGSATERGLQLLVEALTPYRDALADYVDAGNRMLATGNALDALGKYVDIDGKRHIAELIDHMADIKGVEWIRLHYAYPNQFPLELLDVIASRPNVCKYLDIALQHISDNVLTRMHRHVSKQETMDLIAEIRRRVPGINIRTTLLVGFPGETEADFEELVSFVRWARFERMGAFAYSEEEGTYSAEHYEDDVPAEVKQDRLDRLMAVQQQISAEVEAAKVGTEMKVIIDRKEGDYYIACSQYCSPEVDPEVLIPAADRRLRVGSFHRVRIVDSDEFDLYAELTDK